MWNVIIYTTCKAYIKTDSFPKKTYPITENAHEKKNMSPSTLIRIYTYTSTK